MRRVLTARRYIYAILALVVGSIFSGFSPADDSIAVIVGKSPPKIAFDHANLTDIFLKRIQVDDDRHAIVPLNLGSTDPLRITFSLSLLGERPGDRQRYWTERYFQGIAPPYTVNSQEAMLRYVADTAGAIGYVVSCQVDSRVHIAAHLPIPAEMTGPIHKLCETTPSNSE
jgi:hypothetical protein